MKNLAEFLQREMFQTNIFNKIKTRILYSVTASRKSCRLWDNVENIVEPDRPQKAHVYCMLDTKGYNYTHSGCAILIAFPLQQWLHKRASLFRLMYIACLFLCG